jgi:hypothetical protein
MQTSHSPYIGQSTNSIAVKLLQAAAGFVGDEKQLALPLGLAQPLLGKLMADLHHAPDPQLLRAVDIVLAHHQSLIPLAVTRRSGLGADSAISQ